MHMVFTFGPLVEKLTWNYAFSLDGARNSICAWTSSNVHDYMIGEGNTSLANFNVVPLFTMEQMGYSMGLSRIMYEMPVNCDDGTISTCSEIRGSFIFIYSQALSLWENEGNT